MKKKIIIIGTLFIVIFLTIIAIISFLTNKDSKVTISFDTNGAQLKKAITIDKGTTTNLPEIEKEGYIFDGWYTEDGKLFDSKTVITSDTKLVAKWKEKEDCPIIDGGTSKTVKFNTNGGETINDISICVTCTPEIINLPIPKRDGYEFDGWYADLELTKKVEGSKNDVNNATWTKSGCYNYETIIYAKWQKKEECPIIDGGTSKTVKFNTMGGTTINDISICVTCTPKTINLPTPKRDGYTFDGWYADSKLTKKVKGGKNNVESATWTKVGCYNYETTIYAKWQKDEECPIIDGGTSKTVKFNTMGGNTINDVSICVTCPPETINLPTPKRDGYTFEGWYADLELTKKVEESKNNVKNATWTKAGCYNYETTIYAKWQKEEECPIIDGGTSKTVKFNTMGGNTINDVSICVTCPPETINLPTPERDGYTFDGWYADLELTKKVEGGRNNVNNATWTKVSCYNYETTIYAKWQKN